MIAALLYCSKWYIIDILIHFLFVCLFFTGQPLPYFLRGQMANMTFEYGTVSWFVMQATNSLTDRSWETLLMLNLLRYCTHEEMKKYTLEEKSYLHSAHMLLVVTRFACSWGGRLRRVVLMSCPSCCKPMEMTLSCLRSLKISSWRCRSHTQSELCLPT